MRKEACQRHGLAFKRAAGKKKAANASQDTVIKASLMAAYWVLGMMAHTALTTSCVGITILHSFRLSVEYTLNTQC